MCNLSSRRGRKYLWPIFRKIAPIRKQEEKPSYDILSLILLSVTRKLKLINYQNTNFIIMHTLSLKKIKISSPPCLMNVLACWLEIIWTVSLILLQWALEYVVLFLSISCCVWVIVVSTWKCQSVTVFKIECWKFESIVILPVT